LLDSVLTAMGEAKAKTLASIADQRMVQVSLKFQVPRSEPVRREVWKYGGADWQRLEEELRENDWSKMRTAGPDESAQFLIQSILECADQCIGKKVVCMPRCSHPWLNDRATSAIQAKNIAEGTAEEKAAAEQCSRVILAEQQTWIDKTKQEMHCMRRGCKNWWAKSRQLLD